MNSMTMDIEKRAKILAQRIVNPFSAVRVTESCLVSSSLLPARLAIPPVRAERI
jgi:hypothetical protein